MIPKTHSSAFLQAEWRHLAMAHFAVDPRGLEPWRLPGTEPEAFEGVHYLGLVGFRFLKTRILGVPVPCHQAFDEVNLRGYFRGRIQGRWVSGVRFMRERVARPWVARLARWAYREPYEAVPMGHRFEPPGAAPERLEYRWGEGLRQGFRISRGSAPIVSDLATFLAEHRWGFGPGRDHRPMAYAIERNAWDLYGGADFQAWGDLGSGFDGPLADALRTPPVSLLYSPGSPVRVGFPQRMDP